MLIIRASYQEKYLKGTVTSLGHYIATLKTKGWLEMEGSRDTQM